jgi:Tol biopolymer transport system component
VLLADAGLGSARHLAVSHDGSRIAYSTMTLTSNLRGVDPRATGGASPRALTSETGRNSRPVWSHDGAKLAFERWRSGSNPDIWSSDPDGSNAMPLTSDPGVDTVPNWTPDAGAIVFRSDRTGQPTIWQHAIATRHDSLLLDVRQDLDWARLSPDGREIVFNSRRGGGTTNLWRVPTAGGEPHQLTFDSQSMGFACWSPDGQLIGFEMKRGEDSHVAVIPREGGVPLQVTKDKGQSWPYSFSPDGQRIAFAGFRDGFWNIFWVARSNGEERQLTRYQQLNAYVRYPAWSPRDDQIVFEYAETTGNIWMTSPE